MFQYVHLTWEVWVTGINIPLCKTVLLLFLLQGLYWIMDDNALCYPFMNLFYINIWTITVHVIMCHIRMWYLSKKGDLNVYIYSMCSWNTCTRVEFFFLSKSTWSCLNSITKWWTLKSSHVGLCSMWMVNSKLGKCGIRDVPSFFVKINVNVSEHLSWTVRYYENTVYQFWRTVKYKMNGQIS